MPFIMRSTRERSLSVSDNFIGGELFNKSLALMQEEKFEEAILGYENLFHLWKEKSFHFDEVYRVYNNLGICYLQISHIEEALFLFESALEVKPDYQPAKNNLERIKERGIENVIFEAKMEKKYGEGWHEVIKKWLKERKEKGWEPEKVEALSTDEIVSRLKSFNIKTSEADFCLLAKSYFSAWDLARKNWYPQSMVRDWDEDFVGMAATTLWKRWCISIPCFEILEDELSLIFDEINWLEENKENDDKILPLYRQIIPLLKKLTDDGLPNTFSKAFYNYWIDQSYWDPKQILSDLIYTFQEFDCPEEALNSADFLFGITGDSLYLDEKAKTLCHMGRLEEGLKLYERLVKEYPDDFWIHYHTGVEFAKHGDSFMGIKNLEETFILADKMKKEEKTRYQIIAADELLKQYEKQEMGKKGEDLEKQVKKIEQELNKNIEKLNREKKELENKIKEELACQNAVLYRQAWQNDQLSLSPNVSSGEPIQNKNPKIGRNDPCPCGSGKKYKKCCLVKGENERAEKVIEERLHRELGGKIFQFAMGVISTEEKDSAFKQVSEIAGTISEKECLGFDKEEQVELEAYDYLIHSHKLNSQNVSVLELFAKEYANLLDKAEKGLLTEMLTNRFGLWEVEEILGEKKMMVKDIFSDLRVRSTGVHTTSVASPYDIFLGRLESTSGNQGFTGPVLLVSRLIKTEVIHTIENIASVYGFKSISDFVHEHPLQVKRLVVQRLNSQELPLILDWEGYPIKNCNGTYEIKDHDTLVSWLKGRDDFQHTCDEDNHPVSDKTCYYSLLQRGKSRGQPQPNPISYDSRRTLRTGAESMNSTTKERYRTIASLTMTNNCLEIFSISEARFNYCRGLVEKNVKGILAFKSEERVDFDLHKKRSLLEEKREYKSPLSFEENQRLLDDYFKEHYQGWVTTPLPALDNQTPKEALQSSRGKEKLRELLKDMINMDSRESAGQVQYIFSELNISPKDLGLKI